MGQGRQGQQIAFTLGLGTVLAGAGMGQWGYLVAGAIGTYIFPPEYEKPDKYTELGLNTAQVGVPIPLLYGTMRFGGNYVWKGPIRSKAYHSSSSGGKGGGGKKQIAGYKYYMKSAIGFATGEVDITRLWKNNDPIPNFRANPAITIYRGSKDQTADPTIEQYVDNPVPYKGLSYMVMNDFYLGKDEATAPTFRAEGHRYPYDENAGDSARIFVNIKSKIGGDEYGYAVKDYAGNIFAVNLDEIIEYDKDLNVTRILDLSPLGFFNTQNIIMAVNIDYHAGSRKMYILEYDYGGYTDELNMWIIKLDNVHVHEIKTLEPIQGEGFANYEKRTIRTGGIYWASMAKDSQFHYVCVLAYGDKVEVYKFQDTVPFAPTIYDVSSEVWDGSTAGVAISVDSTGHAYISTQLNVHSFDTETFSLIDSYSWSTWLSDHDHDPVPSSSAWLVGGDEILYVDSGFANTLSLITLGINRETGEIEGGRKELDISEYIGDPGGSLGTPHVVCNHDGTLLIGYERSYSFLCLQHILMDGNPTQVMYDAMGEQQNVIIDNVNVDSLQDMSDYCVEEGIGIDMLLNAETEVQDFLQNIMNYIHGAVPVGNDGKFKFKAFRSSDSPVATITKDDIFREKDGENSELIRTSVKDRRIATNKLLFKFISRLRSYHDSQSQADDFLSQQKYDDINIQRVNFEYISNEITASRQAYKTLKLCGYDNKVYQTVLMPRMLFLNVGDVLILDVPELNLNNKRVRVIGIKEPVLDKGGVLPVRLRHEPGYLDTIHTYKIGTSKKKSLVVSAPTDIRPVVWEQSALKNNDNNTLCLTGIREDYDTVAVDIYMTESDNIDYQLIGTVYNMALTATIATDLGNKFSDNEIEIDLDNYPDPFFEFTVEEQRSDRSMCLIGNLVDDELGLDNLEFINYRGIEETPGGNYVLKDVYRGEYYTTIKEHVAGEHVLLVGAVPANRFIEKMYSDKKVGKTIYIKCVGINIRGDEQNFDDVPVYEYTIQGLTRKATHVSGLQLELGGVGLGGKRTYTQNDVSIVWQRTNRVGGIDSQAIREWQWNDFTPGDVNNYDILIWDSTGDNLIATHDNIGDVQSWTYTQAMNIADFGSFTKHFWIGVRPENYEGHVNDVERIEVIIII